MPALLAISGPTAGVRYALPGEATIGRSPSCEIPIVDSQVSRKHARLYFAEGRALVEDLSSRNGTQVNGARIAAPTALASGDRLQVGESTFLFEGSEAAEVGEVKVGTASLLTVLAGADS